MNRAFDTKFFEQDEESSTQLLRFRIKHSFWKWTNSSFSYFISIRKLRDSLGLRKKNFLFLCSNYFERNYCEFINIKYYMNIQENLSNVNWIWLFSENLFRLFWWTLFVVLTSYIFPDYCSLLRSIFKLIYNYLELQHLEFPWIHSSANVLYIVQTYF